MKIVDRNSDPSQVAKRSTGQVLRFCAKFKAFCDEYGEQLKNEPNKAMDSDEVWRAASLCAIPRASWQTFGKTELRTPLRQSTLLA